MNHLQTLIAWTIAHPDAAFACAAFGVAILRAVYAVVSRVVKPYPRVRAGIEFVAALLPDVGRAGLQFYRAATGRAAPSMDLDAKDAELALLRARVAELAAPRLTQAPPEPSSPSSDNI